jgi:hypothetical protein
MRILFKPADRVSRALEHEHGHAAAAGRTGRAESAEGAIIDYYLKSPRPDR